VIQSVNLADLGMHVRTMTKERHAAAVQAVRMTMKTRGRIVVSEEIKATKPAPFDRGNYDRSWKASDIPNGGRLASSSPYASTIDDGRRPGTLPNVQALVGWAKRHGMENPKSAAWAIAIAIKRRGIPAKHVFARAKVRLIEACRAAARLAISGAKGNVA
jgi:hypothetical protein